jgi:YHS domain-containing protein
MKEPVPAKAKAVEYAGGRYAFCCAGCDVAFTKSPEKFIKEALGNDAPVALFLFDPVTGNRIEETDAKATLVHHGVRYLFASPDGMTEFQSRPDQYAARPERESLTCPVSGKTIARYSAAAGYKDYDGVRYYVCSPTCLEPLARNTAGTVAAGRGKPAAPKAVPANAAKEHGSGSVDLPRKQAGVKSGKECCQSAGACCKPGAACCG